MGRASSCTGERSGTPCLGTPWAPPVSPGAEREGAGDAGAGVLVTRAELAAPTFINILDAGKTGWVLIVGLQGSLSFSVCVKCFPESKFCYRKTIYQVLPPLLLRWTGVASPR